MLRNEIVSAIQAIMSDNFEHDFNKVLRYIILRGERPQLSEHSVCLSINRQERIYRMASSIIVLISITSCGK